MGIFDFFKKKTNVKTNDEFVNLQKEGYYELINFCIGESRKIELTEFINKLTTQHNESLNTLSLVISYLDSNGIHFIMAMDWKQEIKDLNWRINSSLKDNFNTEIELPNPEIYGENKSISFKNVFKDYDDILRINGFQITFIDTNGDEYIIIIHKTIDEIDVKKVVKKIGY